jgi:hypothetical protein
MSVSARHAAQVAEAEPVARPDGPAPLARATAARGALPVLLVALCTVVGGVMRLVVAHQSLFADELSTYWIVAEHGLRGVVSVVHTNAEITPPLYFVAAWLTANGSESPELLRLPSLVAGIATIPLVYALGLRTVGRAAALVATVITTCAPFMIYYSAEARGYGVMMALIVLSTLAMLLAIDTGRVRWWVLYAVASCAAMYTHYTSAFALGAQFLWLLWAHPAARKPALLANLCAAVGFLPWTSGAINDFNSPTSKILSALSPFTPHDVLIALGHWTFGYPYASLRLGELPGTPAIVLLALSVVVAAGGLALRAVRARPVRWRPSLDRRLVLVIAIALAVPVGEGLVSAVSTNLFGVRNLASAWPALALAFAALLMAAGPRLRYIAAGLAIVSFAIGSYKILLDRYQRPAYNDAAAFVDRNARPGDVVIDNTAVLTPGPLSPLDVPLDKPHAVFRAWAPVERDHPFTLFDRVVPLSEAGASAVAGARGHRIFVVQSIFSLIANPKDIGKNKLVLPRRYRLVTVRHYPGTLGTDVRVYAPR